MQFTARKAVQPVYKHEGAFSCPHNSRPIALLLSVSKMIKEFVRLQLLAHAYSVNALAD